jgi:hypothetical protein
MVQVSLGLLSYFTWAGIDGALPLCLGLSRLDYLLRAAGDRLSLKQVEFNAILSSFGPLSELAAAMHRCAHVIVPLNPV